MNRYTLRYFFSPGISNCLWAADEMTERAFGLACEWEKLPLSENTGRYGLYLTAWHDTELDWSYPDNPSMWSDEEAAAFDAKATAYLQRLREELGSDFEIIDRREGQHPTD